MAKLMTVSAPDKLIRDLASYKATDPECGLIGCHMYPLGGVKMTAKWTYAVGDGEFKMNSNGRGFSLTERSIMRHALWDRPLNSELKPLKI